MASVAFGQIYLLTEALPQIYMQPLLSFTREHASLAFLPISVGIALDNMPRFYDHFLLKRITSLHFIIKPEHKIRAFAIGAPFLAIGLWWFAWTIPPAVQAPWPVSFLSLVLVSFATNEFECTLGSYLTDSYTIFSASAYASMAFLRAMISGSLPLFTNQMYARLEANNATTILVAIAAAFCVTPVLFLKCGERLREKSKFARYSRVAELKMGSVAKGQVERMGSMTLSDDTSLGDGQVVEEIAEHLVAK
jgi:hypothetical protein